MQTGCTGQIRDDYQNPFSPVRRWIGPGRSRSIIFLILLTLFFPFFRGESEGSQYRQGKIHFSHHQYDKAEECFRRAFEANPKDGNPLFYIGYMKEKQDLKPESITYFRQAVELNMNRDLKEKAFWKIVIYYKFHQDWENLVLYAEKFYEFSRQRQVQELLELGKKNYDPKLAEVNRLVETGKQAVRQEKYDEAVRPLREALRHYPNHREALWLLSEASQKQKNYRAALEHLNTLIKLNSSIWQYHYKAGLCNYHTGRFSQALEAFAAARKVYDKPGDYFIYVVGMLEGIIHLENGDAAAARKSLLESIARKRTPRLLGLLAETELILGDTATANRLARESLAGKERTPEALLVQALGMIEQKKLKSALEILRLFRESQKPEGDEPVSLYYALGYYHLGGLAALKGHWAEAVAALEKTNIAAVRNEILNTIDHTIPHDREFSYRFFYGKSLLHLNRIDEAERQLAVIGNSADVKYLLACAAALKSEGRLARNYLVQATAEIPELWERAQKDPAFRPLSRQDPGFARFLQNRGRTEDNGG